MTSGTNKYLFLFLAVICGILPVAAQDRCGTVKAMQDLRNKKLIRESDGQFEEWISRRRTSNNGRTNASGVYTIPVVIHIVHKGEAIGSGTNISEAQVLSQINVLNKDFNRLNSDASGTPTEFKSVAGSMNIQFVLAKQDPDGAPAYGINRIKGTQNQWSYDNDTALKGQSYWPAEDYLNIWVTDLSSTLLGYAQFPVSDLDGLEDAVDNRLTDGVVIDYSVFGSLDDGAFSLDSDFNKGRTTTHEVGHFLGLRHIWGDDSGACNGSDYVADTPGQGNSTSGCPSNPQTSCSVHSMFQNYMDYTNDACMNLFTQGQVTRMVTVIENSPRRLSLLDSNGAEDPAPVSDDLAIRSLVSPSANMCAGSVVPSVEVKNEGTNVINAVTLELTVNDQVIETKNFLFGSPLQPEAVKLIYFSPLTLTAGSQAVNVSIIQTNGAVDGKSGDNEGRVVTIIPEAIAIPFTEGFTALPTGWTIKNSDGITAWEVRNATKASAANTALYMRFFGTSTADGAEDILFTPVFDLSDAPRPYLSFDAAYAQNGNSADGLKVYVITDCSNAPSSGKEVYSKYGSALATAAASSNSFSPSGEGGWRKEVIDLSAFAGQSHVQLAFVGINDGGNNLYLDNVAVIANLAANIAITAVKSPTPVHCNAEAVPVIVVSNPGTQTITSLKIRGSVNGAEQINFTDSDFNLTPGAAKEVTLPGITLTAGENIFSVSLTEVNGFIDIDETDNSKTLHTVVNTATNYIPLRQTFNDGTYLDEWTEVNPAGSQRWNLVPTNYDQSIYFDAQQSTAENDEAWLVSPSLDLSSAVVASMFFDLSYIDKSANANKEAVDDFRILYSKDCGNSYEAITDNMLSSLSLASALSGNPSSDSQWQRQYINLNSLAGEGEVRIAFVYKNTDDNNLYLDNIEFFLSDNPSPQSITDPFAVYGTDPAGPKDFYVTFNLADRQDVSYMLVDVNGRQLISEKLSDVLNQTYQIEPNTAGGLYFFRLRIGKEIYSTRIFLNN